MDFTKESIIIKKHLENLLDVFWWWNKIIKIKVTNQW